MIADSQQRVREERMRMSKVRRVLGAALDGEAALADPIPAYLACADYLKHSLDRLHAQDHRLWQRLDPHAGPDNVAFRQKLDHLKERLAASEQALAGLVAARDALRGQGACRRAAFEKEARAFLHVFLNILAASRHSTLAEEEEKFAGADWDYVADHTAEAAARELRLFGQVENAAPGVIDALPPIAPPPRPLAAQRADPLGAAALGSGHR
ncbi:MAG: hypothetical protein OXF03_04520 [Gammaproteobacteria bacterium]|nr:hypothetical protein [Gammaproteobacteria bacterium]